MPPFFLSGSRRTCLAAASVLAGIMVLLSGCSDTESVPVDVFAVTSVSVNPEIFLGDVTCGENGMRRYVATLSDVTGLSGEIGGEGEFKLPSSSPVPCFLEVRFERLVIGREYAADIQGYDRDDIVPLGCYPNSPDTAPGCPGSPVMVDAATGEYVTPRWTTSCARHRTQPGVDAGPPPQSYDAGLRDDYGECRGRAPVKGETPWLEGPVCVVDLATIPVRGCDSLKDSSGAP
jgi:hypothetical protein